MIAILSVFGGITVPVAHAFIESENISSISFVLQFFCEQILKLKKKIEKNKFENLHDSNTLKKTNSSTKTNTSKKTNSSKKTLNQFKNEYQIKPEIKEKIIKEGKRIAVEGSFEHFPKKIIEEFLKSELEQSTVNAISQNTIFLSSSTKISNKSKRAELLGIKKSNLFLIFHSISFIQFFIFFFF